MGSDHSVGDYEKACDGSLGHWLGGQELVPAASDRDYVEHQRDMEGSVTESDGQGDILQECQRSQRAQPNE